MTLTSDIACGCSCPCTAEATTRDQGIPVCAECAEYMMSPLGEAICARVLDQDHPTCPDCESAVEWGSILTDGYHNRMEAECGCPGRSWTWVHTGDWRLSGVSYEDEWPEASTIDRDEAFQDADPSFCRAFCAGLRAVRADQGGNHE